ncbi:cytochrome P450 81Q32-like [Typha angustifolia]|uniref:cytochrome P450 81Q32-like n=1 Tax=Typha angustifolia TaxID=59011 RepID=UPI003C2EE7FC
MSTDGSSLVKVEMKSRLYELSLNVIMRMMAGKKYLYKEEARRFREVMEEGFKLVGASNVGDFVPMMRWVDFGGMKKKLMRFAKERDELTQRMIDHEKRRGVEEKKTLVGELLLLQKMDPEYYTDLNIKALLVSVVSAGSDTSSTTIEWAMSLLLNNPTALRKAIAEIDAHVGKERLIEESDLSNLPYLNCVITETLRLYPVAPLLLPHESSEECHVGGFTIPRGTILLVNAYSIQRDPKIWEQPRRFMPERFEDGEKRRWIIPFGMGRRKCVGEGLALREVGLVLGTLLQCFEWERLGEEEVDMTEGSGLTMPKLLPLEALYRPRKTIIDVLSTL